MVMDYFKIINQHSAGETEYNHKNLSA